MMSGQFCELSCNVFIVFCFCFYSWLVRLQSNCSHFPSNDDEYTDDDDDDGGGVDSVDE